ncbi:ferritin-like protein [Rhizobium ruizarguesonis]|uniref:ferritin-like protein n=1 Tax=Rhizobium ruizarguesonis TaxID=2081791 RepID=UPI001CF42D1E|nr:ferritin-like protein [Rhizobium ruizarguesonis]MCB2399355.1 ferritin-like protein [Rhizobium ruizarguesonis]
MRNQVLQEVGIPYFEGLNTAREQAIRLLQVAAEVEHALMVQYLYAAGSIAVSTMVDGSLEEDPAAKAFADTIISIAVEEMGHLGTVQNLLLLLGGAEAFHVQRDELRTKSELNPLPFVLEPVDRRTLARYVAAEMPELNPVPQDVQELLDLISDDARGFPKRVGAIYAVLHLLFDDPQASDVRGNAPSAGLHLTDDDLLPAETIKLYQAEPGEWGDHFDQVLLFDHIFTRAEARTAIEKIMEQGEGFTTDESQPSHFKTFMNLAKTLKTATIAVLPMATSPTLTPGHGGENGALIEADYTKLWAQVQSLQYVLLLLGLLHALNIPRETEADKKRRKAIAELTVRGGMRNALGSIAAVLTTLPMNAGDAPVKAGPPFDLDPKLVAPGDPSQFPVRHLLLLDELSGLYAKIRQHSDFTADHGRVVANLETLDGRQRKLFSPPLLTS